MTLVAAAVALLVGLTLGALGGGGAVLAVPAFVHLLDQTPQQAMTASLVIAAVMVRRFRHAAATPATSSPATSSPATSSPATSTPEASATETSGGGNGSGRDGIRVLTLVTTASAVGFLTGLLGVGGGFVVVPALTLALALPMPVAVGTSLLVIAVNSATALVARTSVAVEGLDWPVIALFTAVAVVASLVGTRLAAVLSARQQAGDLRRTAARRRGGHRHRRVGLTASRQ